VRRHRQRLNLLARFFEERYEESIKNMSEIGIRVTGVETKEQKVAARRWAIPFAGFLLALMGGISYAWGVFVIPMREKFGWTTVEATLPFTVFMVVFALTMVPGGRLQDRLGPRKTSAIGAGLFLVAYWAAALIDNIPYLWWLLLVFSVIGGTACGLTYACVAPPARKWYPDKPGAAISFAVMGFGLAAVVFAPLKADFLIPAYGIAGTFLTLAIIVPTVCFFAAAIIKDPPKGWTVPVVTDSRKSKASLVKQELSPHDFIGKPLFWVIWLAYGCVIAGGLMSMSLIPAYGIKIVGLTAEEAALALSIFAGVNGFGRPLAGMLIDRFGVVTVMIFTYIIQASTLLAFHLFAITLPALYVAAILLGWGFAVTLSAFPALTAICSGLRNFGINNGIVFTAFGAGAFASAIGAWLFDITGSFTPAFVSAGVLAGMGIILCVVLKRKYAIA
jgi:OFA family oxalate/formate antiporter-like MFS transporter